MPRYALKVEYDGLPFQGWQRQAAGQPTVQGTIEAALSKLEIGPHTIAAAGRTDAGVHAWGQVAHCDMEKDWADKMLEGLTESHFATKFLRIYVFTQIFLIVCAGLAFYRYYWLHSDYLYSIECSIVSTVTLILLWITFSALWRGHRTDPGFVTDSKKSDDGSVCCRCNF